MKLTDTQYENIQKYLDNELTDSELSAFEQEIKTNELLAQEIDLFKKLPDYIGEGQSPENDLETEHPQFKAYLKEFLSEDSKALTLELETMGAAYLQSEDKDDKKVKSLSINWRVFSAAAVLLILLGGTWFLMKPEDSAKLYSSYVEHEAIILNQRGSNDETAKIAETLYNQGKYKEAIPLLKALNEAELNYDLVLALGVAYLELDDFSNALAQFESISQSDAIIKDKSLWYEAVTHLKQDNRELSLQKLQQLQEEYPFYKPEETKKLIKKLK